MSTDNLPKGLPSMETEFNLEVVGVMTKNVYSGIFKYHLPNISKSSQIAVMEARLNSGVADSLDPGTKLLHYMLAYLKYTLDDKALPKWWLDSNFGLNLYDANVVTELYQKCFHFEKEWNTKVHGE